MNKTKNDKAKTVNLEKRKQIQTKALNLFRFSLNDSLPFSAFQVVQLNEYVAPNKCFGKFGFVVQLGRGQSLTIKSLSRPPQTFSRVLGLIGG